MIPPRPLTMKCIRRKRSQRIGISQAATLTPITHGTHYTTLSLTKFSINSFGIIWLTRGWSLSYRDRGYHYWSDRTCSITWVTLVCGMFIVRLRNRQNQEYVSVGLLTSLNWGEGARYFFDHLGTCWSRCIVVGKFACLGVHRGYWCWHCHHGF